MSTAPSTPTNVFGYVRSVDVNTWIGTSGALKPDATQRILIGEAYSQGYTHLFLYGFDGTISGNTFSAAAKSHLLKFIQLCIPWGIRIGVPIGNVSNNNLNAIYDFNQTVATNSSETIDYITEDEWWNTSYAEFVKVRDIQTAWITNLQNSGCVSHAYCGHTKVNGDNYSDDIAIIGAVAAVNSVTFTTSGNHGFLSGGTVRIAGVGGFASNPNGNFVMTSASANQFTITFSSGGGSFINPVFTITNVVGGANPIITTSANHNLVAGQTVTFAGITGFTSNPNGTYTISSVTPTTITVSHNTIGGSYGGGGTAKGVAQGNSVYVGTTELRELQAVFDVFHIHIYVLTPYYGYGRRRVREFTIPVQISFIVSTESTTATPPQGNNFSGNFYMGQNAAGVSMYALKSNDIAYKFMVIDTSALYTPAQVVSSTMYYNADTDVNVVANVTVIGITVFTLSFMRGRPMLDGSRIMVYAGANQSSAVMTGSITISDSFAYDDWIGSPLTYLWSVASAPPGAITSFPSGNTVLNPTFNFSAAAIGDYVLLLAVTDGIVTSFSEFTLFITAASGSMTVSVVQNKEVACFGDSTGEALATVASGGVAPFTYAWSNGTTHGPTALTTDLLTGLPSGPISCVVTDSTPGTPLVASDNTTITSNPPLVITLTPTDPLCPGAATGQIVMGVTGGSPFGIFSISWKKNSIGFSPIDPYNPTGLTLGLYEVTVIDNEGCVKVASTNIYQPTAITQTNVITNPSCTGLNDGSIRVTLSGGTGPYTLQWYFLGNPIPGQIADKISGLIAGSYTLTVIDANGCPQSFVFTLVDPAPISVNIVPVGNLDFCLDGDPIDLICNIVSGGIGPFLYAWSGPGGLVVLDPTNSPEIATFSPISSGPYTITCTVTDAQGCIGFAQVSGNISPAFSTVPIIVASGVLGSCPGNSITLTVTNASDFDNLMWSTGETTPSIIVDYADLFSVTGYDVSGLCFNFASITINITPTTIQLIGTTNNTCGGDNGSGAITVNVSGGCPGYVFEWRNSSAAIVGTSQNISGLPSGTYTITATDTLGQTASQSYVISTTSPVIDIVFTDINGTTGGTAIATVTGGTSPITYLWTGPEGNVISTSNTISDLFEFGVYTVVCTDAQGCVVTGSFCLSGPTYSFNMNECDLRSMLQVASCCFGDKVSEGIGMRKNGRIQACQERHSFLLLNNIQSLQGWYREGMVVCVGKEPYYIFNLTQYTSATQIKVRIYTSSIGTEIIDYTFSLGSLAADMDAFIALINATMPYRAFYDIYNGSTIPQVRIWIYAPIGEGYNDIQVRINVDSGSLIEVITTNGFQGGCDQEISESPCLTEDQAGELVQYIQLECGECDCNSPQDIISDEIE